MRFNYPLVFGMLAGAVFWIVLVVVLFNAAGCSTDSPC